jgi:stress-induced-phosphoprotein 1
MSDNLAKAEAAKAEGNTALSAGDAPGAIAKYGEGLAALGLEAETNMREQNTGDDKLDDEMELKLAGVLLSNRSAAFARAGDWPKAFGDGQRCAGLRPKWAKGWMRAGAALMALGQIEQAAQLYANGAQAEDSTEVEKQQCADGLKQAQDLYVKQMEALAKQKQAAQAKESPAPAGGAAASGAAGGSAPPAGADPLAAALQGDILAKLGAKPETAALIGDPEVQAMLREIQADPAKLNEHMSDQRVMACVAALMGVHIPTREEAEYEARKREAEEDERRRRARRAREEAEKRAKEAEEAATLEKLSPAQRDALAAKERGNAAYRARNFAGALEHYTEAIGLDPGNNVFLNNRAAVHLEIGDFEAAREDTQRALDQESAKSGAARDDTVVARAQLRLGNICAKRAQFAQAIAFYEKSLVNARTSGTLKALQSAQRELGRQERAARVDDAGALAKKAEGNSLFGESRIPEALRAYSDAIGLSPDDADKEVFAAMDPLARHSLAVLFNNRAACYMKMSEPLLGIKDCERALKLSPKFVKAQTRKGHLHFNMKEYQQAMESYDKALQLSEETEDKALRDAQETEIRESVTKTMYAMNVRDSQQGDQPDEATIRAAQRDPEIQQILSDPVMQQILQDMQTDPACISDHMANPLVAGKIQKLIGAGILRVR